MNVQTGDIKQFASAEEAQKAGYTAILSPQEEKFLGTMTPEERITWWAEKKRELKLKEPTKDEVIAKIYEQAEKFESRNGFRRKPKSTPGGSGSTFCPSIKDRKYFKKRRK